VLFFLPLLLTLHGTVYSLNHAVRISGLMAEAREQKVFDLFSLTPLGPFGLSWVMSLGCLYRSDRFPRRRRLVRIISLVLAGLIGFMMLVAMLRLLSLNGGPSAREFARLSSSQNLVVSAVGMALVAAFYLDFIHSLVLGLLLAILMSSYAQRRLEAQFFTLTAFLGLQLLTYIVTLLIGFVLLPTLVKGLPVPFDNLLLLAGNLALLFGIRESLIALVWSQLIVRLNVAPDEFEFITRPAWGWQYND
jgi:hypothetical protein